MPRPAGGDGMVTESGIKPLGQLMQLEQLEILQAAITDASMAAVGRMRH